VIPENPGLDPRLSKEHGVWVLHAGQPLLATDTDDMLEQLREDRERAILGKGE